ncbi:uncharacterized protein LOC128198958 [Bicyclus anynana]|uniref:Uncharacterized protein LOC128198958 n=1 Tax=Bicyclus anynana TaxID=110368 RepID=A0ABM3LV45_BICAN|nr:uncharacterized protein LOC128198958 [Bicyclus anynana]
MADSRDTSRKHDGSSGSRDASQPRNTAEGRRAQSRTRSPIFRVPPRDTDSESEGSRIRSDIASRGRSMVRGRGTGITRARAELKEAREEAYEVAFNQLLRDRAYRKDSPQVITDPEETEENEIICPEVPANLTAEELRALGGHNVASIMHVATKSRNLKGTWVKRLKESARVLQEILEALASRTEADETRRLRADNTRLRNEIESLKSDLKAHRREFSEMRTSMAAAKSGTAPSLSKDAMEELKASIVASLSVMIDARFAGIEERLLPETVLRPPLAAGQGRRATARPQPSSVTPTTRSVPMEHDNIVTEPSAGTSEAAAGSSQPSTATDDWATVTRKGGKGKSKKTTPSAASIVTPADKQAALPKLSPPKTAAVMVTLQPKAADKGMTYAQVLERAEQSVNLQELGINDGIRIRRAATGARLLELPKNQTPEQAELLASRLRAALDGIANVVRPTQSATLRIIGLDDSVTKEKLVAAVVRAGNCTTQVVKVGDLQLGPRGMSTATVHCPIEVAKVLSDAGRLLVGWSSAEVQVLEQRPLRCRTSRRPYHGGKEV